MENKLTKQVAMNVKKLRERKKLTLEAAAAVTGVSRSMLAQIEKGDVNPTISVLWKVANGFKVSFTSLLAPEETPVDIRRKGDHPPLLADGGRYRNYPTFPFDETKLFECYRIVIEPQGILSAQPHLSGTEEYITVFAGTLCLTVGGTDNRLQQGDSIRFHADVPHCYQNPGDIPTQLNMLIYYNP